MSKIPLLTQSCRKAQFVVYHQACGFKSRKTKRYFLPCLHFLVREKEKIYHAHMESRQKLVEGNSWQAVAAYIDLDSEASSMAMGNMKANGKGISGAKVPRPMSPMEIVNTRRLESKKSKDSPRTSKKATDLSRMRQVRTMILIFQLST